ncbi:hypothetical protein ID866_5433 [Astraeus odoratus]|nr:hypothetical protein ID866_5433 [Astraeus odoratus]
MFIDTRSENWQLYHGVGEIWFCKARAFGQPSK